MKKLPKSNEDPCMYCIYVIGCRYRDRILSAFNDNVFDITIDEILRKCLIRRNEENQSKIRES